MDQYRTWLSGLKSSLMNCDNETLNSTINIARGTLDGIPQEHRHSTFFEQPQVFETLNDLQKALNAGEEITDMKASLSSTIEVWESTRNPINHQPIPLPSPGHFSIALSPSPVSHTHSESSYDLAEFINFAPRRQESIANRRRFGTPLVSGGQPHPVGMENLLGDIHPKYNTPGTGGARFLPLRVPRSTSAAGLATKPLDFLPANTNRKENDCLRQIFVGQQNLMARYQELKMLIKQYAYWSQKHEEICNQKSLQESEWKNMVDEKLQVILDILRPVSGHPPSGHPPYPPANLPTNLKPPNFAQFTPNFTQFAQNFTQLAPSFQAGQLPTYGQSPLTGQAPMQISTTEGSYSGPDGRMVFSTRRTS